MVYFLSQEVPLRAVLLRAVPLQAVRRGANRVMVRTKATGAKLVGAELWVRR